MTQEEINTNEPEGYIRSDDFDIRKAWYKLFFGGNGDPYISIITEDAAGLRTNSGVRVSVSGGQTPREIRYGIATAAREFESHFNKETP